MTEEQRQVCLRAIDHYGVEHQKRKAAEELGELIVELAREQDGRSSGAGIREEIADCIIMLEQLRWIYCPEQVDAWIRRKLDRLVGRMRGEAHNAGEST